MSASDGGVMEVRNRSVPEVTQGIVREVYAVSAEHGRRIVDPEDMPLDDAGVKMDTALAELAIETGITISVVFSGILTADDKHRALIKLATSACEVASKVRKT